MSHVVDGHLRNAEIAIQRALSGPSGALVQDLRSVRSVATTYWTAHKEIVAGLRRVSRDLLRLADVDVGIGRSLTPERSTALIRTATRVIDAANTLRAEFRDAVLDLRETCDGIVKQSIRDDRTDLPI